MPIDFRLIDAGQFETMCRQLAKAACPDARAVEASPGDEGLDSYVGDLGAGGLWVWQFKHFTNGFGAVQKRQVRESLARAVSIHHPTRWTLMVAEDLGVGALRWWEDLKAKNQGVELRLCSATDIKLFLHNHSGIRQEYFETTGEKFDALRRIANGRSGLMAEPDASIVQHMAIEADVLNDDPDFRFTFQAAPDGTVIGVEPRRPEATKRPVLKMQLSPPPGPQGEELLARTRAMFAKGEALEIDGAHISEFESVFDRFRPAGSKPEGVRLIPLPSDDTVPVSVTVGVSESAVALPFIEFRRKRQGSEEVQLSNEKQRIPLVVELTINFRTSEVDFNVRVQDVADMHPSYLLQFLRFTAALSEGAPIELSFLKHASSPLKAIVSTNQTPTVEESYVRFIEMLAHIETVLDAKLTVPSKVSSDDAATVQRLMSMLDSPIQKRPGTAKFVIVPHDVTEFEALAIAGEAMAVIVTSTETLELFGRRYTFDVAMSANAPIEIVGPAAAERGEPAFRVRLSGEVNIEYSNGRIEAGAASAGTESGLI